MLIYTDNYKVWADWVPEYKHADLSFLDPWSVRKGPEKLRMLMTELGYIGKDGQAKGRRVSPAHQQQIILFAKAIYNGPVPAA
jgi:hypothetical protein